MNQNRISQLMSYYYIAKARYHFFRSKSSEDFQNEFCIHNCIFDKNTMSYFI